jgi:hypothetical protein
MMLLAEIGIEILMIVAVVVGVAALAHLLQLSVREQLYLRRLRQNASAAASTFVTRGSKAGRKALVVLRETRA